MSSSTPRKPPTARASVVARRAPLLRPATGTALAYIVLSSLATSYSLQIGAISEFRCADAALMRLSRAASHSR